MNYSDIYDKYNIIDKFSDFPKRLSGNKLIAKFIELFQPEVLREYDAVGNLRFLPGLEEGEYILNTNLADDVRLAIAEMEEEITQMYHLPSSMRLFSLGRLADRVKFCSTRYKVDYYPLQAVKDVTWTNACGNRFCVNCQSTMAGQRFSKYAPLLDDLSEYYDLYHVVLTIPNPRPEELFDDVEQMYKAFKYLIRYLSGIKTVTGLNFEKYGYKGCIRSLEITKNWEEGTFHPHFHCIFVFKKDSKLTWNQKYINKFSFSNPDVKKSHHKGADNIRHFSEFEILLQKVWAILFDGEVLTAKAVAERKLGYSCIADLCRKGKYHEVFKYSMKGVFKAPDKDDFDFERSYKDFKVLFVTLFKRRVCQGYGCFHGFKLDELDLSVDPEEEYNKAKEFLRQLEIPIKQNITLDDILNDFKQKNITYISRGNIVGLIMEKMEDTSDERDREA